MTDDRGPGNRPAESLLALALGAVSEGTVITDADCAAIYCNAAFTTITGYPADEVIGRDWTLLHGPGTSAEEVERMRVAVREGQPYRGTLLNYRKDGSPFWNQLAVTPLRDASGRIAHFVGVLRDITDVIDEREKLSREASHDAMTGLPNREALRRHVRVELAEAAADGSAVAIAMIDLDGFKLVNDDYGHHSGDLVLIEFAERMSHALRHGDYIARLGGDEFVLVLSDLSPVGTIDQVQSILSRLHSVVETPFPVEGLASVRVGMSMGVALYPTHGENGPDLMRLADAALYRAKNSPSIAHWWEMAGPQDVPVAREAIPGELVMYMQPIVDLRSGDVRQVEALARVRRPDGGIETPDMFLPHYSTAQLVHVFREGLDQALDWLARWDRLGVELGVSVNIPPELLSAPESVTWVREALQRHRMEPNRLGLELLETQELDLSASDQAVSELVQLGVKIHLDDLSSGFSTLKRITDLPFDLIKIDRRFFDQLTTRPLQVLTLLAAITKLGEDIGYEVVVEGIEDMQRLEVSAILGAAAGQGYLFAPPMPADELGAWASGFVSPYQPGRITTATGALAYHWTHTSGNGPEHPPREDCPLTLFLSGHQLQSLHDALHTGDPVAGQELTDALVAAVTGE